MKKKCIYCGSSINEDQTVCGKCNCVKKAVKNGGNTRQSRLKVAAKHLEKKPGLLKQIFGRTTDY